MQIVNNTIVWDVGDIHYDIDVDLHNKTLLKTITLHQYDANSVYILSDVWDDGNLYTIPINAIVTFSATNPDGKGIDNECKVVNNQILYQVTELTTIKDGNFDAEFRIYNTITNTDQTTASALKGSPKFRISVEKSALSNDTIVSDNEFNVLTNLISETGLAIANTNSATENAITATNNTNSAIESANTTNTNIQNAEDIRVTNEEARILTESTRQSNENTRQTNESNRATAESNRVTAENGRVNAETNRVSTESTRQSNESTRQSQEETRQTNTAMAISNANNATTNANNIATLLNTETLRIFKPSVATYTDLATTYPTPENGWTVTVTNESVSYRYNGTTFTWINLGYIATVDKATDTTLGTVKGGGNVVIETDGALNVPDLNNANKETVGSGVLYNSGLLVSAQSTPNMTVSVTTGTAYMPNGTRMTPVANTSLAITTSDATNPRIDIVYVDTTGVISYLAGTASATPTAPSLPSGGILLGEVYVGANVTTITSSNITDKRTIIKSNTDLVGAINENMLRLADIVTNVRNFGVIGDGTNETINIQMAIDYAHNTDCKIVYFPKPLTKYVALNLKLYDNITLMSDSWNTVLEQAYSTVYSDCLINNVGGLGGTAFNLKNVTIRNINLKGTVETDGFSEFHHLIKMYGVSNLLIDHVKFTNWQGDAISIGHGVGVDNIYHNEDITIINSYFDGYNKENRQGISVADCDGILIDNNVFKNITKSTMPGAIDFEANGDNFSMILKNVIVSNNKFYNIGGNVGTISFYIPIPSNSFNLGHPSNFVIENNTMENVFKGIHITQLQTSDITDASESLDVLVFNNRVKNATDRAYWIYGVKEVTLQDNTFEDCANSSRIGWSTDYRKPIGVKLKNNTHRRCGTTDGIAVTVYSCDRLDFIEDIFIDCGINAGTYGIGVYFAAGTTSKVRFIRNVFMEPANKMTAAILKNASAILSPSTNVFKENVLNGLSSDFVADLTDYGYTSSVFNADTLPDSFQKGITTFKPIDSSGLPSGYSSGEIVNYKTSELTTERELITQWFYPANTGGASLTDNFYRRGNDATNTWSGWYKVSALLV